MIKPPVIRLFLAALLVALAAACAGASAPGDPLLPDVSGPALVVFFTDN